MSIPVIDTLHALGNFPVVDSTEVQCGNFRLDVVLSQSATSLAAKADKTYVDGTFAKKSEVGTYTKPSTGIPKSDLASDVKSSLAKADTALQTHQSLANYVETTDARLSNSRPASDVYDWAKSETKPTYSKIEIIGIDNIDNTSDVNKPISSATQAALDGKANNTTITALTGRVSTIEDNQESLSARMDAIESGTTPEDSELIGIRTGVDGTEYVNAGTSVRTQVSNAERHACKYTDNSCAEISDGNHYVMLPDVVQGHISNTNGTYTKGSDTKLCATKDYISIDRGKSYTFSTSRKLRFNLYFYDAEKTFIEAKYDNSSLSLDTITIENTSYDYVKIGCYNATDVQDLYYNEFKCYTVTSNDCIKSLKADSVKSKNARIETMGNVYINTSEKTIKFDGLANVRMGHNGVDISNTIHSLADFSAGAFVYFDPVNATFTTTKGENWYIGAYWTDTYKIDWPIRSDKIYINNVRAYEAILCQHRNARFDVYDVVNIDTATKKMTFGNIAFISCGSTRVNLSNMEIDISEFTAGQFVYFEPSTKVFTKTKTYTCWYVGAFWANYFGLDWGIPYNKLTVDGMPICSSSRFREKTVNCLGDSMTQGVGTTKAYHQWFNQLINCKSIVNYGVGGSCIAPKKDDYPTWEVGTESFLERYTSMGAADIVVVFGGVNDWVTGRTLGTVNDTTNDTFYGSMHLLCQGLIEKYPTSRIYFFTSPQNDYVHRKANIPSDSEYYGNVIGKNRKGNTLVQFVDAMIEVCGIYGIPCKDLYRNSWWGLSGVLGIQGGTAGAYGADSLHPNYEGHKILASKMSSFIIDN